MEKVRLGVIGYGNMGTAHVDWVMEGKVPNMEIGAVCDIDVDRRNALKGKYPEISVFETAEDVFKSGLCDAVIIATPHYDHPPLVKKAFEYGLNVTWASSVRSTSRRPTRRGFRRTPSATGTCSATR